MKKWNTFRIWYMLQLIITTCRVTEMRDATNIFPQLPLKRSAWTIKENVPPGGAAPLSTRSSITTSNWLQHHHRYSQGRRHTTPPAGQDQPHLPPCRNNDEGQDWTLSYHPPPSRRKLSHSNTGNPTSTEHQSVDMSIAACQHQRTRKLDLTL